MNTTTTQPTRSNLRNWWLSREYILYRDDNADKAKGVELVRFFTSIGPVLADEAWRLMHSGLAFGALALCEQDIRQLNEAGITVARPLPVKLAVKKHRFANTQAALVKFQETAAQRAEAWNKIGTIPELRQYLAIEQQALNEVQDAFYEDTKHLNARDHCALADIEFMRRCASLPDA